MDIGNLVQSKPDEEILKATPWLDGSVHSISAARAEMERAYEGLLSTFIETLGSPQETETTNRALAEELYFEALRLSAWRHDSGWIYLAFVHHDRETPVFVSCGYRNAEA